MTNELAGGCLCGGIRYTCAAEPVLRALCHCRHCQKQTSAPFSIVVAVPNSCMVIERGTLETFADVGDSGWPVERSFCPGCGSPIRSFVAAMPAREFIKPGTLDDSSWLAST